MIVRELVTRLGFSADQRQAQNYERTLADIRQTARRAAMAVGALAAGSFELSRRIANAGNEVAKGAVEVGMAADEYQRLGFAISQVTRLSGRESNRALERLNETIGRARTEGGRYIEDLERVGITQEEVENGTLSNAEAFQRVTEAIGRSADANEAAALASRVLGQRSGRLLGPALRENAAEMRAAAEEAERLGGGWSDAGLSASEDFTDAMGRVQLILTTITSDIAERLLPAVQSTIDSFVDWWEINREVIQQNLARYMERVGVAFRVVGGIVRGFVRLANNVAEALGGWERTIRLLTIALSAFVALRVARWLWMVGAALTAAAKATGVLRLALLALQRLGIIALFTGLAIAIEDVITWIQGGDSAIGRWLGSWEDFRETALRVIEDVLDYIDPLIRQFRALGEILEGALTLDPRRVMQGFSALGAALIDWASQIGRDVRDAILSVLPGWMVNALEATGGAVSSAADHVRSGFGAVQSGARSVAESAGSRDISQDVMAAGMGARGGRVEVNARTEATLQVPQGTTEEQRRAIEMQAEEIFSTHWDREMRRALWDFQPVE